MDSHEASGEIEEQTELLGLMDFAAGVLKNNVMEWMQTLPYWTMLRSQVSSEVQLGMERFNYLVGASIEQDDCCRARKSSCHLLLAFRLDSGSVTLDQVRAGAVLQAARR